MIVLDSPIHPLLVHFPIALFLSAWLLMMVGSRIKNEGLKSAAMCMYVMAAFFSLLAVLSGLYEANRLHLKHPLLFAHRNYAIALCVTSWCGLWVMFCAQFKCPKRLEFIFKCVCWLSAALVILAGYYGGSMVYQYGIGVNP